MRANHLSRRLLQPIETGELEEIRRGTIFEIGAVVFGMSWVMMVSAYAKPEQLLVAFILLACSLISIWLWDINLRAEPRLQCAGA